jgi:putative membrane protein
LKTTLKSSDRIAVPVIIGLSIAVPVIVLVLMLLPERYNIFGADTITFPLFHAILNFATAVLLIVGYFFMTIQNYIMHRNTMIAAFGLSVIFLVSYVLSKISNEPVPYGGEGLLRYIYFFILITHIVLSAIIVPLVLFTMYRGLSGQYNRHAKIARWTFPIWLYVAITGVLVFLFMIPYY